MRLQKKFTNVIVVPQKSTFEIQDKLYVYVIDKNNKVQQRNIESIARLPHLFIISKGLDVGEKILYEGIQNIKPDMIIKSQDVKMNDIIKNLGLK